MRPLSTSEIELLIDALEAMAPILTPKEQALAIGLIDELKKACPPMERFGYIPG